MQRAIAISGGYPNNKNLWVFLFGELRYDGGRFSSQARRAVSFDANQKQSRDSEGKRLSSHSLNFPDRD